MKLLKKMALSFLVMSGFFVSGAFSEETKSPDTSASPSPQEATTEDKDPKKHPKKLETSKPTAKHKDKPQAAPVKDAKAEATPKASSGHQGWFVGVRGAYVPAVIVEIGYEFNNTFKLRVIGEGGKYYRTYSIDSQRYNHMQFQPRKIGLMADWHPWKNGFRLSGGISYNADRIRLNHTVTNTLLGLPASVFGTIAAKYKFRVVAPYLGLGYDTGSFGDSGINLSADAGFWFQGRVRSSFSLSGTGRTTPSVIETTKVHLERLLNQHKLIRTMPMVSVGIRYLF